GNCSALARRAGTPMITAAAPGQIRCRFGTGRQPPAQPRPAGTGAPHMESHIAIGAAHWAYLAGVIAIVLTMVFRANVVVPAIIATFLVTLAWTHSPVSALASIFNASFVAARELFNIFLVIALMTALLNALKSLRADV